MFWKFIYRVIRYDPHYTLTLEVKNGTTGEIKSAEMESMVSDFFDVKGNLRIDLYHPALMKLHEGLKEPKKAR